MSNIGISSLYNAGPIRARGGSDGRPQQPLQLASSREMSRARDEGISVETTSLASASGVPVDSERVRQIRDALREGTYPLNPTKIADAMIAARLLPSVV